MSADSPTQLANLALDQIGINFQLGDIEQGGNEANAIARAYDECRQALLRTAPWVFARKQQSLVLLADASGATPNVSRVIPGGQNANRWCYEYAYPIDCRRMRFIPGNQNSVPGTPAGNIAPPNNSLPLLNTSGNPAPWGQRMVPTPFVVTNDPNFTASPNSSGVFNRGQSPEGNTVILSNVQNATLVYTFDAVTPSLWDDLFRQAFIAYLGQKVALKLWAAREKPDIGMKAQQAQILITKQAVLEARIADGNEMTASSDIPVDWIRFRRTGGSLGTYSFQGSGFGYGCWGGGWNGSLLFADGSAY